ncbi:MAG: transglutaminase-like domain-containing protein, partial [Phycisphaerales bacterium]|nr:transglutaminase-like domain-containing protein [Phycisphaerales bacterium]
MTQTAIRVTIKPMNEPGWRLLAPTGISTPYQMPMRFSLDGAAFSLIGETGTGQMAALAEPEPGRPMTVTYLYRDGGTGYPENLFVHRESRFTRATDALVSDALGIADTASDGHAAISTIVNEVAQKFSYGHPEERLMDGQDAVPYLSCGLTEGSCVEINTYLSAMLRSAGFEAGYVTGYFFPAEKNGCCDDMHCWVVTRHQGVVLEWDIAHHMKMQRKEICCGLNPKPGTRVAVAHSMGLTFPEIHIEDMKLLAE